MTKLKLLTFTTLYPNKVQSYHGIFVEHRLRHLLNSKRITARVIAPVPWFPFQHSCFGRYAIFARVPYREERHAIPIAHPRYPLIPKISMTAAPYLLAAAARPMFREVLDAGYNFDLIDAHYFYPDGVAAVINGRYFGRPVTITAHGTDINLISQFRLPRKWILWAARQAASIITVSEALRDKMLSMGVASDKVQVLRNGVDLELFHPIDRAAWRKQLGLNTTTLLSVGQLIDLKGHDIVIRTLVHLPQVHLLIAGEGRKEVALKNLAKTLSVSDRVKFLGAVPHEDLKIYYGVADAVVLSSSREGLPSVLLEALACGTPVIASNVGGIPEIVAAPEAGIIMRERTPTGLLEAFHALLSRYPSRAETRRYAERFAWDETTYAQAQLFERIKARCMPN